MRSDFEPSKLLALQADLKKAGCHPYLTSVGGPGFGIFDLQTEKGDLQTPTPASSASSSKKTIQPKDITALRKAFERQSSQNVPAFGSHEGEWLYA